MDYLVSGLFDLWLGSYFCKKIFYSTSWNMDYTGSKGLFNEALLFAGGAMMAEIFYNKDNPSDISNGTLPVFMSDFLGITNNGVLKKEIPDGILVHSCLVDLNDNGYSVSFIAEIIEKEF